MRTPFTVTALSLLLATSQGLVGAETSGDSSSPGSPAEPIRLLDPTEPDFNRHDGGLRPVVGTHNIQVMRANRTQPDADGADGLGWTYNHAPMLCYWNDTFYLQYLTDPVGEHIPPGQTLLTESRDGYHWTRPRVAFPPFTPEGEDEVTVSHQRMGFYVAPNGRLLMLSFYGRVPRPNDGQGIGRAVREVRKNGAFGPIHFIRYNTHAGFNEDNTPYPFYQRSEDKGFLEACEALLADKLMTQQWWEEDRSNDGFYAIQNLTNGFEPKALSFYHRQDGAVVGLWKKRWTALSMDNGNTWTTPVQASSLITGGAKIWGQRTDDGRYALAYNPHGGHRWPLVVVSGEDGITFDHMNVVHGEIPYPRFDGQYKSMGPQYVRGIAEGNGNPPGSDLWLTYSVNKEDIWITRVPVPLTASTQASGSDDFNDHRTGLPPDGWNVYAPRWAPVTIERAPRGGRGRALLLRDRDRYDHAKAVRVFRPSEQLTVSLRLHPKTFAGEQLSIELLDGHGARPVRVFLNEEGLHRLRKPGNNVDRLQVQPPSEGEWITLEIRADVRTLRYDILLNNATVLASADFVEENVGALERLCLRTGPERDYDAHAADLLIDNSRLGDRIDGDQPVAEAAFYIDELTIGQ